MSGLHKIHLLVFVVSQVLPGSESRGRRCYVCRSRGELGDCKDPFDYNATTAEEMRGVETPACASGWCAKIVEGGNDDFDTATERRCIQRPPVDGEERCSDTIINRRPVYMCFCLGDLCNHSDGLLFSTSYTKYTFCLFVTLFGYAFLT